MTKQEAVRIGNFLILAKQDDLALQQHSSDFLARGYQIHKTDHFVICQHPGSEQVILFHTFDQHTIDADLICLIESELTSILSLASAQFFGAMLFGILASTFPHPRQQEVIWRQFCVNTLHRLSGLVLQPALPTPAPIFPLSYITPFASIYRRVVELAIGQRFLDVGSSFGFFPILLAEMRPPAHVIGCDKNSDILAVATDLAQVSSARNTEFMFKDVLAGDFEMIGHFDTVTAIHLLEHLSEEEVPRSIEHLLHVTRQRLLISVPYEERATLAYGHQQVFTREKLEQWGRWCMEHLENQGRFWCEDVMGGLLVVERQL